MIKESIFYSIIGFCATALILVLISALYFVSCFPDCPVGYFGTMGKSVEGIESRFILLFSSIVGLSVGFLYLMSNKLKSKRR